MKYIYYITGCILAISAGQFAALSIFCFAQEPVLWLFKYFGFAMFMADANACAIIADKMFRRGYYAN